MVTLSLAVVLFEAGANAQSASRWCSRAVTLRDGRIATRAPQIDADRPREIVHPPDNLSERSFDRVRLPPPISDLELPRVQTQIARMPRDHPERAGMLLRLANVAYTLAWQIMHLEHGGRILSAGIESPCSPEFWQPDVWRGLGENHHVAERDEVMAYCTIVRDALEAALRESRDLSVFEHASTELVYQRLAGGHFERAVAVAEELARRHPGSRRLPAIWFALADYHDLHDRPFDAIGWYERYVGAAEVDLRLYDLAHYRIGMILLRAGDHVGAMTRLGAVARQVGGGASIRPAWGAAIAYAMLRLEERTWSAVETAEWIQTLVQPDRDHRWSDVFDRVISVFEARGRPDWAIEGYEHLLATATEAYTGHRCAWSVDRARLLSAARPHAEVSVVLSRLLEAQGNEVCNEARWSLVYRTAARWHDAALRRVPREAGGLRDAARLYALLLSQDADAPFGSRLSDVPDRSTLAFYRAEALFEAGDECESAYLAAMSENNQVSTLEVWCKATICRDRLVARLLETSPGTSSRLCVAPPRGTTRHPTGAYGTCALSIDTAVFNSRSSTPAR